MDRIGLEAAILRKLMERMGMSLRTADSFLDEVFMSKIEEYRKSCVQEAMREAEKNLEADRESHDEEIRYLNQRIAELKKSLEDVRERAEYQCHRAEDAERALQAQIQKYNSGYESQIADLQQNVKDRETAIRTLKEIGYSEPPRLNTVRVQGHEFEFENAVHTGNGEWVCDCATIKWDGPLEFLEG